jgi:hypothetical protein
MPDTQPTGKMLKSMPEGVEKGLSLTLRSSVGLNGTFDDKTDKRHQNIEQLFSTPTMSQLPDGFKTSGWFDDMPSYDAPIAVGLALMTRRKRPIATFLVNHSDGTGEGIVVFAMRGDRKETRPKFIELEGDVVDIFTDSLFMTHPRNCSNFHPWFSSILMSFAKVCRGKSGEVDVCMVSEGTDRKIKKAIESNRIVVAVCPPNSMTTEHLFHKLAQEAKPGTLTKDQVQLHEDEWERVVWKPSGESQSPVKLLKSVSSAINNYLWLDDRKSCGKNEDPIDDDTSVANQPATNPDAKMTDDNVVSVASELTKSGISKKKNSISTQSKFVSDSVTGSMTGLKREIEKEEEQTKAFAKKMKAVNPKGKGSSDKKSTEEHQDDEKSSSGSESEMSVDESTSSDDEEDDSDEDGSDEDDSDENDDSDEDESDENDDSDEDKKEEKENQSDENDDSDEDKKEEKGSKHKRPKKPETNSENKIWKQPTLAFDGCGNPKPSASNNRGPGEAQRARHLVAAQAKLTFDAVENCNGIPLSNTEKIKNILDKLRAKYVDYGGDKPPRTTYAMHTDGFELTMALVNILNAHNGVAQQGADGNATRRLAVNTTAALLQIIPSINNVTTSLQSSLSAIGELNNIATSVSEDFNKTVATLSTSETP